METRKMLLKVVFTTVLVVATATTNTVAQRVKIPVPSTTTHTVGYLHDLINTNNPSKTSNFLIAMDGRDPITHEEAKNWGTSGIGGSASARKIGLNKGWIEDNQNMIVTLYEDKALVRHLNENRRVLNAVSALGKNDILEFGKLMNESHESLKTDYEVSCFELDTMVDIARSINGVIGARMTGGGFGGCTVNIVKKQSVDNFCSLINREYVKKTGIKPQIYICNPENGARKI